MPTIPISPELQTLLNAFGNQTGGTSSVQYQQVYNAIVDSPALTNQLNHAAIAGTLNALVYKSGVGDNGAFYSNGTITITKNFLSDLSENDVIFVLGHEAMHITNNPGLVVSDADLLARAKIDIQNWNSATGGGVQDLTAATKSYVDLHLKDEATANIQGWNDILSRAIAANGGNMLSAIDMQALIEDSGYSSKFYNLDGTLKLGFLADEFGGIPMSAGNIEAAARDRGCQNFCV